MENFYAVFDATDPTKNRLGLSYNVKQAMDDQSAIGGVVVAIILVVVFVSLIGIALLLVCIKNRRAERLEKAKTYFDSLKTSDDGEQAIEEDSRDEALSEPTINPNNFLKSTEDEANEQLTGDLL